MELLRNCEDFFNDLRSGGAFAEMLCDAKEEANEIDIPANFEFPYARYRVRCKNVNFDYEARDNPVEDPKLKIRIELYFFTIDQEINALEYRFNLMSTHKMMLTDGDSVDINALDLADEIMSVSALLGKKERPIEVLKFISVLEFEPNLAIALRILLSLPISVQCGFRPKCWTVHQLLRVTELIHSGFAKHEATGILFLDIAKAFDKIWHDGLLIKLIRLDFPPP
ncbi:uncharacterized protein TNCV_2156121 [Trichonephila clavipes]|nr:uncharacterized protein TNCV_2156121 [Trichonephila clavipes]